MQFKELGNLFNGVGEISSRKFKGVTSIKDMLEWQKDSFNEFLQLNSSGISAFTMEEIRAKSAVLDLTDSLTLQAVAKAKDADFTSKVAAKSLTWGEALKDNNIDIKELEDIVQKSNIFKEENVKKLNEALELGDTSLYRSQLTNMINDVEGLSDTIIDLGDNTAKAGTSISTYFKGMVASIKPLLPAILGVTAAIAAFSAIDYTQHSFTRALEDAENMASEYSDAQGKLSSLNEEYKTTQERLSELQSLQSSGSITFAQEIELQNLQESNRDLERQIDLQKSLVEIKSQASAESAKEASTTEKSYVEHKEDEYGGFWGKIAGYAGYFGTYTDPETGLITSPALQWESKDTTTEGLVKSNIEDLEDYESQLESLQEQLKDAPENPNLLRQQENLQKKIATVKSDLNDEAEILQGFIEQSRDSSTGKIHKGMETYVDSWTKSLTSIQNIGKSQKEIDLNNLNNFFSTSGGSAVKKNLENVVKSTKNAKDALIEFKKAGLDLEDIDVSESGFIRYFEDIIKAADEATKAAEKVNNNLTVDDISTAFESKNAGDDYVALNDYIKKAKDLYDQGLVGTDDFKSVAEMMSYNIESSAESFAKNYEKIKRYFTEDTNGNLTGAGINQFLTDLQDLNKGYAVWDENAQRWNINMDNTAQAAKELDIGVGVFESMLGRIKDYDDIGDFDFHSAIDDLETAKSSLEGLKTIRDEIDDSSKKKLLDSSIEDWESQYSTWENDLATLDENAIIHLKLEYDLASIQQEIDKTKALIEAGDDSVSNYAGVISGNEQYINTAESTLGISDEVKVPVSYEANEESIEALKFQLASVTDEETKKKIQIEIENLQDVQKQFLDAFADSEFSIGINEDSTAEQVQEALQKFSESGSDIEILAKMDIEDSKAKEKIADLLGVEVDDIKVPVDVDVNDALANLEEVDRFELVDKLVKVEALDGGAIPTLELWNSLEMSDKSASLTAQDQATFLISYWNLLTPEEKEAILNTNMQATDDATPTINSVDNAVNSMNLDPNVRINASDYASGTINGVSALLSSLNGRTATTYINTVHTTTGKGDLEGTAHKDGTAGLYPIPKLSNRALAMGSLQDISWLKPQWKTKEDDVALTGELGQELVVKGNRWWTVGDNGTEFAEIPQGSIVFNHKQTEELFKKGFTNSRGNARLAGTAFAGGATGSFSFKGGASIYTPTSSYTYDQPSNDNTAAINDNTAAVEENTEAQENLHDWIAHNVDIHSAENERLSKTIESFEMHANQNAAIDNYVNNSQSYMNTLRQAQNAYMSKANSLGLDEGYIHKIWAGDDFSIQDIQDEELKEKIEKYTDYYNKAKDLGDQMTELNQKIREAKISKLENIQDDYDNLVSFSEGLIKYNEAVNELFESRNLVGNQDAVMNSMNQQAAIRQALMNEQQELNDQLNALVASGDIAEYTDTWLKWKTQINEVGQSIVECDSALEELKESILEIRLNEFNKSLDNLDFTSDMASSLRGLMSEEGIYDDNVRLTESGIAQLGLMGTELVSAKQQVANYNVAINALGKDLANGNITQAQYNKKLQEYQKSQMDAVKATNSSRQAILDLIKDGIRKETEAMEELISKRKEDLSKQKEYYDYQKKMSDKSKDMNNMRAQIAVLEGDDSLEALSKARKLRSELQELQEEYDEAQKDHEYDVVQDAYDETLDRFKENQEETLYELETNLNAQNVAIADALEVAKSNYQMVYGQLQEYAAQYSITLTDSLTSPWMNAMTAIQQYQASVGKINGNVSIDTSAIQTTAPSANQTVPTTNEAATQNLGKSANGTWVNQGNRWWYQHADGGWTENDWEKIDGQWYKFDNKGWMQTGWQKWNNDWYYLDNNTGAMKSGWQKINDQWYYMDGSGKMLASQWIDNKYYVDHTGAMARNGYIKSQNSDLYYWVNDNGEWEQKWDTRFPDLKKYNLFYSSGTKKAKKGYGFVDDKNKKLDLGSELIMEGDGVLTDYGVLRPLRGDEMIFNDKQREALWKLSNYYDPSTLYSPDSYMNDLPMVTNNSTQEINVHYDNLIGNIEHMDRNTLPDLETILKKSFDYSVKELKKYAKR